MISKNKKFLQTIRNEVFYYDAVLSELSIDPWENLGATSKKYKLSAPLYIDVEPKRASKSLTMDLPTTE